jgi:hypothetical protein
VDDIVVGWIWRMLKLVEFDWCWNWLNLIEFEVGWIWLMLKLVEFDIGRETGWFWIWLMLVNVEIGWCKLKLKEILEIGRGLDSFEEVKNLKKIWSWVGLEHSISMY